MKSEFAGQYYDLGAIPAEEQRRLESLDLMMTAPAEGSALDNAGIGNDWPRGRGVFNNGSREFCIHVNGQDHLRVICQNQGGDIGSVFEDWISANNGLEHSLSAHGGALLKSDRLGYITTSPADVGTGLRAGMVLRLAALGRNEAELRDVCAELGLLMERHPSLEHCWDVSNKVKLGKSEVEIVQQIIDGVAALTQKEVEAEARTLLIAEVDKECGSFELKSLAVSILNNIEVFGKRDSVVAMSMGPEWSYETSARALTGDGFTWCPDLMIPITTPALDSNLLVLSLKGKDEESA
ncbi:Ckmt1, partial [Symbiodinium microadriaticum]